MHVGVLATPTSCLTGQRQTETAQGVRLVLPFAGTQRREAAGPCTELTKTKQGLGARAAAQQLRSE